MTESLPRLLLVDDDAQLAAMLHEYLELQNFDVEIAASGELALETIAQAPPDLIILDVMLPGKNGYEICKNLRENHCRIPILMLTAKGQEIDKESVSTQERTIMSPSRLEFRNW